MTMFVYNVLWFILGVLISTSSFPVLRCNRIFEGGTTGVEITNGAGMPSCQ